MCITTKLPSVFESHQRIPLPSNKRKKSGQPNKVFIYLFIYIYIIYIICISYIVLMSTFWQVKDDLVLVGETLVGEHSKMCLIVGRQVCTHLGSG